jgi:hypothetical protein
LRPLARLAREVRAVVGAASPTHRHLRDRLVAAFWLTLAIDIVASAAIYLVERDAKNTDVKTVGSAFFWVTSQLLTVSSSFQNPITPAGRVIDIFLELYAITVVGALAGMFGSFFHRRSVERAGPPRQEGAQASSD